MMKVKYYRCPVCNKPYKTLNGWGEHVSNLHPEILKEGYSYARLFYFIKTGKTHGICVECKGETEWNESSWKYERYCKNPECKKKYAKTAHLRNKKKYGKSNLLDEPERQRKMLENRRISGTVEFDDGGKVKYVGSYEHNFLDMLNAIGWSSNDIMAPSPNTYYYDYKNPEDKENEGKKFYIPDFYLPSINFEVEIKQSKTTHQKMIHIDRIKEQCKDKMMHKRKDVNYIKVIDNDFSNFFELLLNLKEKLLLNPSKQDFENGIATESNTVENDELEAAMENFLLKQKDVKYNLNKFGKDKNVLFITGLSGSGKTTLSDEYSKKYGCPVLHLDDIEYNHFPKEFEFLREVVYNEVEDFEEVSRVYCSSEVYSLTEDEYLELNSKMDSAMLACINELKRQKRNYIVEGLQIYYLYNENELKDDPIIIKGTSVLTSVFRRVKRNTAPYFRAIREELGMFLNLKEYKRTDKKLNKWRKTFNENELAITQESLFNFMKNEDYFNPVSWKKNLFGFLKPTKSKVQKSTRSRFCTVKIEDGMIKVYGIKVMVFERRVENYYKDKSLKNIFLKKYEAASYKRYLKKKIGKSQITVEYLYTPEFFALELCKLFTTLATRYRDNTYMSIANQIYENSWLKQSDTVSENVPLLPLDNLSRLNLDLTLYQKEFISLYPKLKSNLNLNGYILAFVQGLGKTITSIGLAECLDKDRIYIVCPNSLKPNWALEIKKYYKKYSENEELWKREVFICGANQHYYPDEARFIITNNESISKMYPYIHDTKLDSMLILDESHNFRNLKGKRTTELLELRDKLACKDILVMSGTPIKAAPSEIVPALLLIDPSFTMQAAQIYSKAFKLDKVMGTEIVEARFGKIMYRKEKDELPDLPEKNVQYLKVDIMDSQDYLMSNIKTRVMARFTEIFEAEMEKNEVYRDKLITLINKYSNSTYEEKAQYLKWISNLHTKNEVNDMHELDYEFMQTYSKRFVYPNIPEWDKETYKTYESLEKRFIRMKERCLGLALGEIVPPARVKMFTSIYDENIEEIVDKIVESPKKTVIFSQFKSVVNHIADDLNNRDIGTVKITGDVNSAQRLENLTQFKEDDMVRVIVATSQTIGTGVTLTEANQMFFFGPPWRSTDFEQCTDRIHRIGQTDDVYIYNVVLDTGNEENLSSRMDSILQWSNEMFTSVISKTEDDYSEGENSYKEALASESYIMNNPCNEGLINFGISVIDEIRYNRNPNNIVFQQAIIMYNKLKKKYLSIKPIGLENNEPSTIPYSTFKKKFTGQDWDVCQYMETELNKLISDDNKIDTVGNYSFHAPSKARNYYLEIMQDGRVYNHTITVALLKDEGYLYIEPQFSAIEGIYYPMSLEEIINFVLSAMAAENNIQTVMNYSVYEYHIDNNNYGGRTENELIYYIKQNGKRLPHRFSRVFSVNKLNIAKESLNEDLYDFCMIASEEEMIDVPSNEICDDCYEITQYFRSSDVKAIKSIPYGAIIGKDVCSNDIDGKVSTLKTTDLSDAVLAHPKSDSGNVKFIKRVDGLKEKYDLVSTKTIKKGEHFNYNATKNMPEFFHEDRIK